MSLRKIAAIARGSHEGLPFVRANEAVDFSPYAV